MMKIRSSLLLLVFGGLPVFLLLIFAWGCASPNEDETFSTPLPTMQPVNGTLDSEGAAHLVDAYTS
jgi:hypothetical protein